MKPKNLLLIAILALAWIIASGQKTPFMMHSGQLNDNRFTEWIIPNEEEGIFYFRKL